LSRYRPLARHPVAGCENGNGRAVDCPSSDCAVSPAAPPVSLFTPASVSTSSKSAADCPLSVCAVSPAKPVADQGRGGVHSPNC
jgi:hypothetical protein